MKLLEAAQVQPGGNVLDVGHGSGESLIFQLTSQDAPRPARLTGITSLKLHYQRSLDRTSRLQTKTDIILYHGDAIFRPTSHPLHPLDPSSPSPPYNAILALDCAYHFDQRATFLQQSLHRLAPRGRIALADICFSSAALRTPSTRWLIRLCGLMPAPNVVAPDAYAQRMRAMGYVDVRLEDISADVFPHFARFLRGRGWGWAVFAAVVRWWARRGMRFVVISGAKPAL